jgi:predicted TPR repeat methyltransferase
MTGNFEQAKEFFQHGIAHYEAGRFEQAERDFAASLALLPGRASTLTNLGAARLKLGQVQQAADLLEEALAREPDNLEALGHRAAALAELGQHEPALACIDRALAGHPELGTAWALRGQVLKDLGRFDQARASFQQAIAHGADDEFNRYCLSALSGGEVPKTAPAHYVEALFDGYADGFEEHLVEVLKYRAPEILVAELARSGRRFARALDLGCGTGLCGLQVRPLVDGLDGVDLSSHMVEVAGARKIYDELVQADLVQHLASTPRRYDLVLAADVFIYVGALEAVFDGVARVLEPAGVFCFSVESMREDEGYALRPSLRYAHSLGYIRKLAEQYGFEIEATSEHAIREDQRMPLPGRFSWLSRRPQGGSSQGL